MQYQLQNIAQAAAFILNQLGTATVLCFDAPMGSGKTTLIVEICKQLGITDTPSSPTFSIINKYENEAGKVVYHLDLYRIKDEEELLQAGVEEVLYSGDLCFVEWPQIANFVMPDNAQLVDVSMVSETERLINIKPYIE